MSNKKLFATLAIVSSLAVGITSCTSPQGGGGGDGGTPTGGAAGDRGMQQQQQQYSKQTTQDQQKQTPMGTQTDAGRTTDTESSQK